MKNPRKNGLRVSAPGWARNLVVSILLAWTGSFVAHGAGTVVALDGSNVPSQATNVVQMFQGYGASGVIAAHLTDGNYLVWGGVWGGPIWNTNALSIVLGEGNFIELRTNHTVMVTSPPSPATGLTNVVAVYMGAAYYALRNDGTVVSWSSSGSDTFADTLTNVVALSMQGDSTQPLALRSDGTVVAWPTAGMPPVPQGLTNVVAVSAGPWYNLALLRNGTVVYWGNTNNPSLPVTNVPPGLSNVVAIDAGLSYALALLSNGTVVSWGRQPLAIPPGLTNVSAIALNYALVDTQFPGGVIAAGATISNGTFNVNIPSLSGRVYSLEYTTNLGATHWTPLPLVAGNGGTLTLTDTNLVDQQRFYRVRRW